MTEPWIERVIREAQEEGKLEFKAGQPIAGLARPYDPSWWAKRWVATERQRQAASELVRDVERRLPRILSGTDEVQVRAGIAELNTAIAAHNVDHPDRSLNTLDEDRLIAGWRTRR